MFPGAPRGEEGLQTLSRLAQRKAATVLQPAVDRDQVWLALEISGSKYLVSLVLLTAIDLRLRSNSLVKSNSESGIARVTQGGAARGNGLYISMHPRCETVYQAVPVRGIGACDSDVHRISD